MKTFDEIYEATFHLTQVEKLKLANKLTGDYDGTALQALAEAWAEDKLKMTKANKGEKGVDGTWLNNRNIQVKSKKSEAHSDRATYVTLSKGTLECADDLLVLFVDYETGEINRSIGPIAIDNLIGRNGRYYVSDMIKTGALDDKPPFASITKLII